MAIVRPQPPIVEVAHIAEHTPELEEKLTIEKSTVELTTKSEDLSLQPRTSPYTEAPVALHIGSGKTVHYVLRHLVPPGWMKSGVSEPFYLLDIERETGHTLVHYLYTGAYETLDAAVRSPTLMARIKLKRALLVYIMASKYDLVDLEKLAAREIDDHGSTLDIFECLEAINDEFERLCPGSWVHGYLLKRAGAAFNEDHTVFANENFLETVNNAALNKFMMRCAMDLYNARIMHMLSTEKELFRKLNQHDRHVRNWLAHEVVPEPEHKMDFQVDIIASPADIPPMEACCDHESIERETVATEEFCTISCSASDCLDKSTDCSVDPYLEAAIIDQCCESGQTMQECCYEAIQVPIGAVAEVATKPIEEVCVAACHEAQAFDFKSIEDEGTPTSVEVETTAHKVSAFELEPAEPGCITASAENELCCHWVKHILGGDTWKTCKPCRTIVEQLV